MRARMIGAGLMAKGGGISPGRMPDDRRRRHRPKRKARHGGKPWERPAVAGRAPGGTLLVYASLSSLGWGNGGPVTVIQALLQAAGPRAKPSALPSIGPGPTSEDHRRRASDERRTAAMGRLRHSERDGRRCVSAGRGERAAIGIGHCDILCAYGARGGCFAVRWAAAVVPNGRQRYLPVSLPMTALALA